MASRFNRADVLRLLLGILLISALAWWGFLSPFSDAAQVALYNETGLRPDQVEGFYRPSYFYFGMVIWLLGVSLLTVMLFTDLLTAIGLPSLPASAVVLKFPTVKREASRSPAAAAVVGIPFAILGRFVAFVIFYYVGLRALDVHGTITGGSTLVRPEVFSGFTRGSQVFLSSFFNTVSFVGEFATLRIRSGWDAAFVLANVIARFFAVFLLVNAAFLRLNLVAGQRMEERSEAGRNSTFGDV